MRAQQAPKCVYVEDFSVLTTAMAVYLDYGASADLMSASESDSAELTAAKQRIRELIVSWIAVQ